MMLLNATVYEAAEGIEKRALNDSENHRHQSVTSGH